MSLADAIKNATRGVVPKIIGPNGVAASVVNTTRFTKGRDDAARPTNTPTNPLVGVKWYITEMADGRVQFVWGQNSNASYEALVPIDTNVTDNDVVQVTSGDFQGLVVEVEQKKVDPLANMITLALAPTGKAPHAPPP